MSYHIGTITKTILQDNNVSQSAISAMRGSDHAKYTNHLLTASNDMRWSTFRSIMRQLDPKGTARLYLLCNERYLFFKCPISSSKTGELLEISRNNSNLSLRDVGNCMNVAPATVRTIEKTPTSRFSTIKRYLKALPERYTLILKFNNKEYILYDSCEDDE